MISLRLEAQQYAALRAGFDAAAGDPDAPIDVSLLARVRNALTEAKAAALPGLPILVMLKSSDELAALSACFDVGGEGHADVTDDHWDAITALIEQAARP